MTMLIHYILISEYSRSSEQYCAQSIVDLSFDIYLF